MYQIQNRTANSCEVLLYSLIDHGYTAMNIINQLKAGGNIKNITLRINSDGGDVFEAIAIYNYLKSLDANITVYVDGIAASAASVIACAGRVVMPSNTQMMIHNPFGLVQGDSEEMRAMAAVLDKVRDSIASIYEAKSKLPRNKINNLMDNESWLSAQECFDLGLCDEVTDALDDEDEDEEEEQEPSTDSNDVMHMQIDEALKAERQRLQELDALMTPESKNIINKAKYETLQSAKDIALELLQLQARRSDSLELSSITPYLTRPEDDNIRSVAEIINRKRGYKDVR